MVKDSLIGWTHHTQNYWVGCHEVSAACDFCYAKAWAKRSGHPELWEGERRRTKTWNEVYKLDRSAGNRGVRERVFSNSLADFFDNKVPKEWRSDAWDYIRTTRNLDHLILTKRPQNIIDMLPADWGADGYPNVWLGTTVENQTEADRRIPHLLAVPAKISFLSCEPLLGPLDVEKYLWPTMAINRGWIDWIISGGESGPKRRDTEMAWHESLQQQCIHTDTSFYFKQDTALYPGQRGRASDELWAYKQIPGTQC